MNIIFVVTIAIILLLTAFLLGWLSKELQIRNYIFSQKRTPLTAMDDVWNTALEKIRIFIDVHL